MLKDHTASSVHLPQRNFACWNHAGVEMGRRCLRKVIQLSTGNGIVTSQNKHVQKLKERVVMTISCEFHGSDAYYEIHKINFMHHENFYTYGIRYIHMSVQLY